MKQQWEDGACSGQSVGWIGKQQHARSSQKHTFEKMPTFRYGSRLNMLLFRCWWLLINTFLLLFQYSSFYSIEYKYYLLTSYGFVAIVETDWKSSFSINTNKNTQPRRKRKKNYSICLFSSSHIWVCKLFRY